MMKFIHTRGRWRRANCGIGLAIVVLSIHAARSWAADAGASNVIDLGAKRELFVDRFLIDRLDGAFLKLHEPIADGPAIKSDKPWEGPANFGLAIFQLDGRWLMYYRGMTLEKGDDTGRLCVAVSEDGLTWTKPKLGVVEHRGDRDTNIIGDEQGNALMVTPWLDTRPGVPKDQRVKAFYSEAVSGEKHTAFTDPRGPKRLVMFASADGFKFRKLDPQPQIVSELPNSFDGGNSMFWSDVEQQYVLYYRIWDGGRSVGRTASRDFLHWDKPVRMTYGNSPREQFYTNQTQPYPRAPHLYLGIAARFMEGRRVVTDEEVASIDLKRAQNVFFGNDCSDGVLLSTRAGSTAYDRTFMETFIRPGRGAANWVSRTNYPLTGLIPLGDDQLLLFATRHYMQDSWHVERFRLRTDGFASLSAPWASGEMLSRPLTFTGNRLDINFRTSAAGSVRVELQNEKGEPLPGCALADCPEIIGDYIDRTVRWRGGADLAKWAGTPVRLRFVLKDADLFSLQFKE